MKSKILLFVMLLAGLSRGFVPLHPNWPLEVLTWDIDKAYPGIRYEYRLGVKDGEIDIWQM